MDMYIYVQIYLDIHFEVIICCGVASLDMLPCSPTSVLGLFVDLNVLLNVSD